MGSIIEMLDEEFSRYLGCRPEDLRTRALTVLASGAAPVMIAVTSAGGVVSSSLVERSRLMASVEGCDQSELFGQPTLRRLTGLLPMRRKPWSVGEVNVLYFCTRETFRPCAGPAEPVRPDDALWEEAREAEREFAEEGKKWHVEAAFAVYVGLVRTSTARLIDQGRHPFRAVGIRTGPEFRRRGYAKACVSAVTAWALERGLVPLYNTQTCNPASMAVARAVGYTEYIRYLIVT